MKFATKATRNKTSPVASAARVNRARAALESLGARESATIDARTAILLALAGISTLVSVTNNNGVITVTPFDVLNLTFNDSLVGLDDAQMVLLYGKVSTAINDARVDGLIQKNLLSSPSAAVTIIDVADLIQLWIDNPDLKA